MLSIDRSISIKSVNDVALWPYKTLLCLFKHPGQLSLGGRQNPVTLSQPMLVLPNYKNQLPEQFVLKNELALLC